MIMAKEVFYEGRVQGVGFRYAVKKIAQGFDVVGTVENLPDGRVHLRVSGEAEEVDEFLRAIRESALAGHIQKVDASVIPALAGVRGFTIIG